MLYIIATPIGNSEDISLRALRILKEVDFILSEDTRKSGMFFKRLGIKKPLVSFFEHNEIKKIDWIVSELEKDKNIALVSSAGTPTISDPGYKLVRECRRRSLAVTSLPGASSLINALALTSIPHEKFTFLGYLPRKSGSRKKAFESIKNSASTAVFFESPYRLIKVLSELKKILSQRKIAVIREMTKKFEEVKEGSPEEILGYFAKKGLKGELVVIVGPAD